MTERRTLMVVHAHPDDEVFSTGGTLAKYAAAGARVIVVYTTRGEAGEMYHEELDFEDGKRRLGEIREQEAREALKLLGVRDAYFLGYRDSGMKDTDENKHPDAFVNAPLDEAVERLQGIMRETQPDVVITYDPASRYDHPDHVMASKVTFEAFDRAQGEPWAPHKLYIGAGSREGFRRYVEGLRELNLEIPWLRGDVNFEEYGKPEAEITAHIDISDWAPLKKRALAVHRTQIKPDLFYLQIPDETFRTLLATEYFMRVRPPAAAGEHEEDLFAGVGGRQTAEVGATSGR